jgi:hypothetical protein
MATQHNCYSRGNYHPTFGYALCALGMCIRCRSARLHDNSPPELGHVGIAQDAGGGAGRAGKSMHVLGPHHMRRHALLLLLRWVRVRLEVTVGSGRGLQLVHRRHIAVGRHLRARPGGEGGAGGGAELLQSRSRGRHHMWLNSTAHLL